MKHPSLPTLGLLGLLLWLPACQQLPAAFSARAFSRPVGADPGSSIAAPSGAKRDALLCRVPDAHFAAYAEETDLRRLLTQLDALAAEIPHSATRSAGALASDNAERGISRMFSEEEALAQEEQYLSWTAEQRLAYATQAMRALLAAPPSPTAPPFGEENPEVEDLRGAIGGYVGRSLMLWQPQHGYYVVNEQVASAGRSRAAYQRLMLRCMLEDVAANRTLPTGTRCAALSCLQRCYSHAARYRNTGSGRYLISALPREGAIPTLLAHGDYRFSYTPNAMARFNDWLRVQDFLRLRARPRSAELSAEELADSSRHSSVSRADLLRAEQQYKALGHAHRITLAKEVLAGHLAQPLTPSGSGNLRSLAALDVEPLRREAGGIFAEEHPQAALLFKRMVARVLLEEELSADAGIRSCLNLAAIESLRHLCREALAAGEASPTRLMLDALPPMDGGFEEALFDGGAW